MTSACVICVGSCVLLFSRGKVIPMSATCDNGYALHYRWLDTTGGFRGEKMKLDWSPGATRDQRGAGWILPTAISLSNFWWADLHHGCPFFGFVSGSDFPVQKKTFSGPETPIRVWVFGEFWSPNSVRNRVHKLFSRSDPVRGTPGAGGTWPQ